MNLVADPATVVLHELRAPLGLVATAARSAADGCEDDATRLRCEMIARAAERMLRTADEVFRLNEACSGEDATNFRPYEVVTDIVGTLRGLGSMVELRASTPGEFVEVLGNPRRFEALVQSLLTNAIDHGEPGEAVAVTFELDQDSLCVHVENRVAAKDRHDGLGIGTAVVEALAERLGGALERQCDGDRFRATLRLPLARL